MREDFCLLAFIVAATIVIRLTTPTVAPVEFRDTSMERLRQRDIEHYTAYINRRGDDPSYEIEVARAKRRIARLSGARW
jgi:hypothetical protein